MTPEQRAIYDRIVASRGSPAGPFVAWLVSPELADRAQALGEFARYRTVLGPRLSELAILQVARHSDCPVEWAIHEPFAREAGLPGAVIESLRDRRVPHFDDARDRAVHDFTAELLAHRDVDDHVWQRAREVLDERALVELTGLVGYYLLVAMTLNTFRTALPEGLPEPFPARR